MTPATLCVKRIQVSASLDPARARDWVANHPEVPQQAILELVAAGNGPRAVAELEAKACQDLAQGLSSDNVVLRLQGTLCGREATGALRICETIVSVHTQLAPAPAKAPVAPTPAKAPLAPAPAKAQVAATPAKAPLAPAPAKAQVAATPAKAPVAVAAPPAPPQPRLEAAASQPSPAEPLSSIQPRSEASPAAQPRPGKRIVIVPVLPPKAAVAPEVPPPAPEPVRRPRRHGPVVRPSPLLYPVIAPRIRSEEPPTPFEEGLRQRIRELIAPEIDRVMRPLAEAFRLAQQKADKKS